MTSPQRLTVSELRQRRLEAANSTLEDSPEELPEDFVRRARAKMEREYLSREEFTYEKVNRASKACGPLVQWVEAQVNYSSILAKVGPLREELAALEDQATVQ